MQEKQKKHGIVWFRNNLRVKDNTSLHEALASCHQVTGVYCFDPVQLGTTPWGFPKTGGHRRRFFLETLKDLKEELLTLNIPLHFGSGRPGEVLPELVRSWHVDAIYTQKEWTSEEEWDNRHIKAHTLPPLIEHYDQFLIHPDHLPFEPENVPEVFTRFRKQVEAHSEVKPVVHITGSSSAENPLPGLNTQLPQPDDLGVVISEPDNRTAFPCKGGTSQALERIDHYFWKTKKLQYYKRTRNGLTGIDYSSKLSPWLANGSISARMIYHEVKQFEKKVVSNQDTYWLIFELLWRDYFKYISMKHGNRIFLQGGIKNREYEWRFNKHAFKRWTSGNTGNDFVDANMIELARTGWMSNRGRQNVASYWAKDLEQDWRAGAAWFESQLIDYDVHSNWGNWNYVSGVGNDPRNRKFNTKSQAERYDTNGSFRKLWLQNTLF
ncbi:DASH family cryptochrome [Robertkochia sediminum]|uniref:DASH family cryptochrome n=1 Tax=Robertkochia sediminum TaxID=2785326 RepID=UPI001933D3CA|nr:DASH family cryptochrome [Robertkochia sediminum]MBL7471670.1 DASH family cryptochrome [Robertkochia sediminum]